MKKLRRIGELNEHKHVDAFSKQQYIIYTADNQVDIVEQGREQHDQSMRLIEQCEDGERSDEEEAVSSSSWKEFSEVQDDCNIQEERLDEANEIHWGEYNSEYNSAVDESTSNLTTPRKYKKLHSIHVEYIYIYIYIYNKYATNLPYTYRDQRSQLQWL